MAENFGVQSTADDVLEGKDLSGKTIVVTGVSAGLGVEIARSLAAHGAHVIGTARDLDKARKAIGNIPTKGQLELVEMNLASLASVRTCADELLAMGGSIDVVICNAGVMACPQGRTEDGFETHFGTNHLGHFVFVKRIFPLLRKGSRVVTVSSGGHRFSDVNIEDPNFERTEYNEWAGYGRSKTANILFAVEFDRRFRDRGIRAVAIHPGSVRTELGRHIDPAKSEAMIKTMDEQSRAQGRPGMIWKSVPQGAATPVWAGVVADIDDVGGRFCEDCHVAEIVEDPAAVGGVRPYALNPDTARALWTKSEQMVFERF